MTESKITTGGVNNKAMQIADAMKLDLLNIEPLLYETISLLFPACAYHIWLSHEPCHARVLELEP